MVLTRALGKAIALPSSDRRHAGREGVDVVGDQRRSPAQQGSDLAWIRAHDPRLVPVDGGLAILFGRDRLAVQE